MALRDELKQVKPFRSLEEEATLNVTRTSAILEHALIQALKPHAITPTQYNVLRILRGSGGDGLCRNEVGQRMVRQVPDVTRLLDRMEQTGLIARVRSRDDRRFVSTHLTPKGRSLVDRLDEEVGAIHRRHLGHLGESQLKQLVELLTKARAPEG